MDKFCSAMAFFKYNFFLNTLFREVKIFLLWLLWILLFLLTVKVLQFLQSVFTDSNTCLYIYVSVYIYVYIYMHFLNSILCAILKSKHG